MLHRTRSSGRNWSGAKAAAAWVAVLAVLVPTRAWSGVDATGAHPNILFILSDDQRWDTIAALGNREIHTPNVDRLVERGFHFTNAYCMGAMISAVCTPSRAMIMTGRSLWRIPQDFSSPIAPSGVPLLPTVLEQAGYVTFHCGKDNSTPAFASAAFATNIGIAGRTAETATHCAGQVLDFLSKHDGARPFFVYLAPAVPHDARLAPERFAQMYDPAKLSLSRNFMPAHPFDNGALEGRDENLAPHPRTPDAMRRHLADYYASISHLDFEVGRILSEVERRGWTDRTIVIYGSDQGLAVGGRHGLMGKQNLYEHVKPPLIFAGPAIPHGKSDALVYLFDLFPTICDLAGAETPAEAEGQSLLGMIRGRQTKLRDTLLGAYIHCQRMIRDERWKLIRYQAAGMQNTQLFDLAHDPDELRNLAEDPRFARERTRLEGLLARTRRDFGDPVEK
jgi:arylsulfatase A-like enzyme